MRHLLLLGLVFAVAACGGSGATPSSADPTVANTPEPTVTPTPTPDEQAAYRDTVCEVIDPLIMTAAAQMGPTLDALANDDAQGAARERAQLDVLVEDVRAALESGPDYDAARTFETRLVASLDAFLEGLDAFERGSREFDSTAYEEASGLFEVSSELFDEATAEFGVLC